MADGELSAFLGRWLPQIEEEMQAVLAGSDEPAAAHYGMMRYHLGWADAGFRPEHFPSGKRVRPILCLLACAEVGGDPTQALPAAAAIELLHNFSLIHDDIEDGDELRRHRPTVWKLWGVPQAINVGDGMFALAYAALQRLTRRGVRAKVALAAFDRFTQTCVALTEGQHLDLCFEERTHVSVAEYLRMVQGKTAALIGASVAIGALIGGASPAQQTGLLQFGQAMGLAFQIQDDILGIWGNPDRTGKAAGNDILRRKKSLPLLHALNHAEIGPALQSLFAEPPRADQLPAVLDLLERAGTRRFAEAQVETQHALGMDALAAALGQRAASSPLAALAEGLLQRDA
ncbi:MAG TPA: polyprenyl synthetase family protein [Caldilineaceae bacterium]|nr:polyprenyl synthetase family protein [Caldilineaceae bacterium]